MPGGVVSTQGSSAVPLPVMVPPRVGCVDVVSQARAAGRPSRRRRGRRSPATCAGPPRAARGGRRPPRCRRRRVRSSTSTAVGGAGRARVPVEGQPRGGLQGGDRAEQPLLLAGPLDQPPAGTGVERRWSRPDRAGARAATRGRSGRRRPRRRGPARSAARSGARAARRSRVGPARARFSAASRNRDSASSQNPVSHAVRLAKPRSSSRYRLRLPSGSWARSPASSSTAQVAGDRGPADRERRRQLGHAARARPSQQRHQPAPLGVAERVERLLRQRSLVTRSYRNMRVTYSSTALASVTQRVSHSRSGSRRSRTASSTSHSARCSHPHDDPVAGAVLVEASGVDRGLEPPAHSPADVAGELVPAVPEQRRHLVVRVAAHRLGVDRQPRLAVGGEHVLVVQVGVDHPAHRRGVRHEPAAQRHRLLDEAVRQPGVAGQRGEPLGPAVDVLGERAQLRRRRHVEAAVEPGDDPARLEVPDVGEVGRRAAARGAARTDAGRRAAAGRRRRRASAGGRGARARPPRAASRP